MGREVLERDLPPVDRRGDRQVAGDGVVERDQPVEEHRGQHRGRERLSDRADLEHRVGLDPAAPDADLAVRVDAHDEAGMTGRAAPEDLCDSLFDHWRRRFQPRLRIGSARMSGIRV
jgi:hypothetical protein